MTPERHRELNRESAGRVRAYCKRHKVCVTCRRRVEDDRVGKLQCRGCSRDLTRRRRALRGDRRVYNCGFCPGRGHNVRTCPMRAAQPERAA